MARTPDYDTICRIASDTHNLAFGSSGSFQPDAADDRALIDAALQWARQRRKPPVLESVTMTLEHDMEISGEMIKAGTYELYRRPEMSIEHPEVQTVEIIPEAISRVDHYARVTELLEANNAEVERRRAAEKKVEDLEHTLLAFRQTLGAVLANQRAAAARQQVAMRQGPAEVGGHPV